MLCIRDSVIQVCLLLLWCAVVGLAFAEHALDFVGAFLERVFALFGQAFDELGAFFVQLLERLQDWADDRGDQFGDRGADLFDDFFDLFGDAANAQQAGQEGDR